MAIWNAKALAALVYSTGILDGNDIATAVAVALGESSGNDQITNSIPCVGLWQINVPVHSKAHKSWTVENMKDGMQNAAAMFALSSGGHNWQPWDAYKNGSYQKHMAVAKAGVTAMLADPEHAKPGNVTDSRKRIDPATGHRTDAAYDPQAAPIADVTGKVSDAVSSASGIDGLTKTLREASLTAIPFVLALVLIVVGVLLLNRNLASKIPAVKVASKVLS